MLTLTKEVWNVHFLVESVVQIQNPTVVTLSTAGIIIFAELEEIFSLE